jgi:Mechanosensitive ion channel, conserved TM helix
MVVQSWTNVVVGSLEAVWVQFANFIPALVGAIIVLIIGLIVAAGLGALVEKIFDALHLDGFLEKLGLKPYFDRAGLRLRASYFLGRLVYWFIVIAFLLAASDSLGLYALSSFLGAVLAYLPNVIAAVLILLAAVVIGNFLRRVVMASVMSAKLHAAHFLGTLTWWSIVVFGFLAALTQLNIAVAIIQSIVTGFIAMLALAGGLAFGLGGKDYANHLLNRLRDRTEPR